MNSSPKRSGYGVNLLAVIVILLILISDLATAIGLITALRTSPELAERLGIGASNTTGEKSGESNRYRNEEDKVKPYPLVTPLDSTIYITGEAKKTDILKLFQEHRDELMNCYSGGLAKNPHLKGELALQLSVIQTGNIRTAVENGTKFADETLKKCIIKEVKKWQLPKKYKGLSTVKVNLLFMNLINY